MNHSLTLGAAVAEIVSETRRSGGSIDVEQTAIELYLRYFDCGYSRQEIAAAIVDEAEAARVRAVI